MGRRRGYFIEKRGDSCRIVVSAGTDAAGKRLKITRTFHGSESEAMRVAAQLYADVKAGRVGASAGMTLAAWSAVWLDSITDLSPTTLRGYRSMLNGRILPVLGQIPLDRLESRHIIEWLDRIKRAPRLQRRMGSPEKVSGTTLLRNFRVLCIMLNRAVYHGLIPDNPAKRVEAPKAQRQEARHYDRQTCMTMLKALDSEPLAFRALVLVAVTTGLRRGELIGLTWDDILWEKKSIRVVRSAYSVHGNTPQAVKVPKSFHSTRTVPLAVNPPVAAVLREWQAEQRERRVALGADWRGGDYIFTEATGSWTSLDYVSRRWQDFLTRHALPPLSFHGLRHTAATLLMTSGLPVLGVSRLMGHSQPSTTANIYGHRPDELHEKAAEIMASLMPLSPDTSPYGDNNT